MESSYIDPANSWNDDVRFAYLHRFQKSVVRLYKNSSETKYKNTVIIIIRWIIEGGGTKSVSSPVGESNDRLRFFTGFAAGSADKARCFARSYFFLFPI